MAAGWVGKILEVDLNTGCINHRDTMVYAEKSIGGRAMAAWIAWEEMPAGIDAYDPGNIVIIATGPLTGTLAPTSGRTIMSSLSPRVYPKPWYTHSTLGGWFGPALKYAGFDAIIVRGKSETPVYLDIQDGKATLVDATALWGMDARQTQLTLKAKLTNRVQILTIGPAGENLVRFATVQHSEDNAAGHSGFGAVWGSKKLKAIAVRGTRGIPIADPNGLLQEVLNQGVFKVTPCNGALSNQRALKRRPICSQACTFNCFVGEYAHTVEEKVIPIHCIGGIWASENGMKRTKYTGGSVDVPAGQNFGFCEEATLHEECNNLGLDLWFRLVMQPWLIGCIQRGIHEIKGYPIAPTDIFWFDDFMHQLAYRKDLGNIFADDLLRAMDELETELPEDLIQLGRELEFCFGFPAHREGRFWDETPLPFWVIAAMMYASESRDPTIGSHQSSLLLADFLLADREIARHQFRLLSDKVWGYPDALEPTFENKAPVAIWSQNQHMLIDSLPLCDFAFPQLVHPMEDQEEWKMTEDISGDLNIDLRLLTAVTGVRKSREELTQAVEQAFTLERMLLARAGRSRKLEEGLAPHFKLPCRVDGTLVDETGFSHLLDEYYSARGWDLKLGWPQEDRLNALGLAEVIPELRHLRSKITGG